MTFPLQWHPKISQPAIPQTKINKPLNHQQLWRSETPYLHRSFQLLCRKSVWAVCLSHLNSKCKCLFDSSLNRALNSSVHIRLVLNEERLMDYLSCRVWGLSTFRPSRVSAADESSFMFWQDSSLNMSLKYGELFILFSLAVCVHLSPPSSFSDHSLVLC